MEKGRDNLAEIKALYHGKARLRIEEVRLILGNVGRDYVYDLLQAGTLVAQNKLDQVPGRRGIFILAWSVWRYLEDLSIPASAWLDHRGDPALDDAEE